MDDKPVLKHPNLPGSKAPGDVPYTEVKVDEYQEEANEYVRLSDDMIEENIIRYLVTMKNIAYIGDHGGFDIWLDEKLLYNGEFYQNIRVSESFTKLDLTQATDFAMRWIRICEGEDMKVHYTQEVTSNPVGGVVETKTTEQPGKESSVVITENTKGEPRVSVKIYDSDPHEAASKAVSIYYATLAAIKSQKGNKHG